MSAKVSAKVIGFPKRPMERMFMVDFWLSGKDGSLSMLVWMALMSSSRCLLPDGEMKNPSWMGHLLAWLVPSVMCGVLGDTNGFKWGFYGVINRAAREPVLTISLKKNQSVSVFDHLLFLISGLILTMRVYFFFFFFFFLGVSRQFWIYPDSIHELFW